jgi:release factor glutamine methyltransferase
MHLSELRLAARDLPEHEIWRLLTATTGRTKADLLMHPDLTGSESSRFEDLVQRRRQGQPLQYLEGTVQFGPLELLIDPRALVPRPETEQLWDLVVTRLADAAPEVVVDLCTGSGNLALALQHSFPGARVVATELDKAAGELARQNAVRTGLPIEVYEGDLFSPLPAALCGTVDLIVANPPYLAEGEFADLPVDVRVHEPHDALVAGPLGTEIISRIAGEATPWLRPGGLIAVEVSEFAGAACRDLFADFVPELLRDLSGRDRFVLGHRSVLLG